MITIQCRGLTYAVFNGEKNIAIDDLVFPVTGEVIRVVPDVMGSKWGAGGAVLVIVGAIGVFTPWGPALGGAPWGMYSIQPGAAIMAGGVIQMLSPQTAGLASKLDSDNKPSYAFGSVTNTAVQGYSALLCGKWWIGGAIISAGIYVEDQQ